MLTCASCGAAAEARARFCASCGASFAGDGIPDEGVPVATPVVGLEKEPLMTQSAGYGAVPTDDGAVSAAELGARAVAFTSAPAAVVIVPVPEVAPDAHMMLACFACCCCCNPIGALAVCSAVATQNAIDRGDLPAARKNSQRTKSLAYAAIILTMLSVVVSNLLFPW